MLHINITIFLVILNAVLLFNPVTSQYAVLNEDNSFINSDSFNNYQLDNKDNLLENTHQEVSSGASTTVSSLGFIDTFKIVIDFIAFLFGFVVALPTFLFRFPEIDIMLKFMMFVPLFIAYTFVFLSWIRTGGNT